MLTRHRSVSTPAHKTALRDWFSGIQSRRKRTRQKTQTGEQLLFQTLESRLVMHGALGDMEFHALDPIESTAHTESTSNDVINFFMIKYSYLWI